MKTQLFIIPNRRSDPDPPGELTPMFEERSAEFITTTPAVVFSTAPIPHRYQIDPARFSEVSLLHMMDQYDTYVAKPSAGVGVSNSLTRLERCNWSLNHWDYRPWVWDQTQNTLGGLLPFGWRSYDSLWTRSIEKLSHSYRSMSEWYWTLNRRDYKWKLYIVDTGLVWPSYKWALHLESEQVSKERAPEILWDLLRDGDAPGCTKAQQWLEQATAPGLVWSNIPEHIITHELPWQTVGIKNPIPVTASISTALVENNRAFPHVRLTFDDSFPPSLNFCVLLTGPKLPDITSTRYPQRVYGDYVIVYDPDTMQRATLINDWCLLLQPWASSVQLPQDPPSVDTPGVRSTFLVEGGRSIVLGNGPVIFEEEFASVPWSLDVNGPHFIKWLAILHSSLRVDYVDDDLR